MGGPVEAIGFLVWKRRGDVKERGRLLSRIRRRCGPDGGAKRKESVLSQIGIGEMEEGTPRAAKLIKVQVSADAMQ